MNIKRCAIVGIGHRSHARIPEIVASYHEQPRLVALCDPIVVRTFYTGRKRAAFTLLELLAVIAIIAILAAVLFPNLQSSIQASQSAKCMQGQRQLYSLLVTYAADNDASLPLRAYSPNPPDSSYNGPTNWLQFIQKGLNLTRADGQGLDCPANKRDPYSGTTTTFSPKQGYNSLVGTSGVSAKLSRWASSNVVLLADVAAVSATPGSRNNYYFEYKAAIPASAQNIDPKSFWLIDYTLHQGRANLTFGDGHTQAMRPEDVYAGAKANPPTILFQPQ